MRKTLLNVFSFRALFVLYLPIYSMFRYQYSWFSIGINSVLLCIVFYLIKDLHLQWIDNEYETGFQIKFYNEDQNEPKE